MKGCRPLTPDEVELIARSFGGTYAKRDRALFLLGAKSGFRISELLSLRVRDVLQAGRFVDRVTVQRRHMKKKTEGRTVLLHPAARVALQEWLDIASNGSPPPGDHFVFQSRKGANRPLTRVQAWRVLREAFEANELTGKLGTHTLRKTFAAHVHENLAHDLAKTQQALGHRNINSTVQYLSFEEEEIDKAILAL